MVCKINQLPKTSRGTVCNFVCNSKFILQVVNIMGCLGIVTSIRRCTFLLLERYPNPSMKWRDTSRAKADDELLPMMDVCPLRNLMDR